MPPIDLRPLFAGYPARFHPRTPPEPLGNAGGLSGAKLWRFESPSGRLVARAWPVETTRDVLTQIHAWLVGLKDLEFLPIPLPGLDGSTIRDVSGRLWEVAPWKPGAADLDRPPRIARLRSGVSALATIHARLARSATIGPSPGLSARLREIENLRAGGFEGLVRAIRGAPDSESKGMALLWIASARGLLDRVSGIVRSAAIRPVPLQPCLRDVRPDHFLFEGDRLTGLVDFGALGIESVSADLARLFSESIGPDALARSEALSAYRAIRPLSEAEAALIPAFEASSSLLIGGHWARWAFVEPRRFDDPSAIPSGLRRGLDRLGELVSLAPRP